MSITTPLPPLIACSEFYLPGCPHLSTSPNSAPLDLISPTTTTKLKTLGPSRIKDMRAAGITMQVVSHIPISATPQMCVRLNDALHAAICTNPDRFAALALLSVDDPREAARELQRCVARYRFVGGVLGIAKGWDGGAFGELWTQAEWYGVPIVFKEAWPTKEQAQDYTTASIDPALQGPMLTGLYAACTSSPLPIIHMYASGVFDRHPNLRIVLCRTGITLLSLLPRIQSLYFSVKDTQSLAHVSKPNRSFLDVWLDNIYIAAEDAMDHVSIKTLLEHIPVGRLLYATGYPFQDRGREVMMEMRDGGVLSKEEWEKIAWKNAERLFGLKKARGR